MPGWFRVEADSWPEVADALAKPWPRGAALIDLRWFADRERVGAGRFPSRRQLVRRWGWTDHHVRSLLRSDWRDPHARNLPEISQESPKNLPEISQPDAARLGSTGENLPEISQKSPKDLPEISTRASITQTQTQNTDDLASEAARDVWSFYRQIEVDGERVHKHSGRRVPKAVARSVSARMREGATVEEIKAVLAYVHQPGSWWYEKRAWKAETLLRPTHFGGLLESAKRSTVATVVTVATGGDWSRVLDLARGGWRQLDRGDPYRAAARKWGQLNQRDRDGARGAAIRKEWADAIARG